MVLHSTLPSIIQTLERKVHTRRRSSGLFHFHCELSSIKPNDSLQSNHENDVMFYTTSTAWTALKMRANCSVVDFSQFHTGMINPKSFENTSTESIHPMKVMGLIPLPLRVAHYKKERSSRPISQDRHHGRDRDLPSTQTAPRWPKSGCPGPRLWPRPRGWPGRARCVRRRRASGARGWTRTARCVFREKGPVKLSGGNSKVQQSNRGGDVQFYTTPTTWPVPLV